MFLSKPRLALYYKTALLRRMISRTTPPEMFYYPVNSVINCILTVGCLPSTVPMFSSERKKECPINNFFLPKSCCPLVFSWFSSELQPPHPWRLTWNITMEVWKIISLSKWVIWRFQPLIFQGVPLKSTCSRGEVKHNLFVPPSLGFTWMHSQRCHYIL